MLVPLPPSGRREPVAGQAIPPPVAGPRHRNVPDEQRPFGDVFDLLLLSTDPPDHRRLRTLVSPAFTPQKAELYRPLAESVATELVSALPDDFDLVEDYAAQLSFTVICMILGVPIEDSRLTTQRGRRRLAEASTVGSCEPAGMGEPVA
jgi:cytochrome P450